MSDEDVRRLLVRAVLEPEFRDLVRRAPDEAFRGYDLSDDDRDTLSRGDAAMLGLLGRALGGGALGTPPVASASTQPSAAPAPSAPTPPSAQPVALAPLGLHLHIQPYALQTPEGLRVTCAVTVQQAPPAAAPAPSAAPSAPAAAAWKAWDHDLDSPATRAAAAAVRDAAPEVRAARIAELLASMTRHERIGGADGHGRG